MNAPLVAVNELVAGYIPGANILRGVSLKVEKGELVAIVGPNGAGKSTLLKCISGLLRARSGSVSLSHRDVTRMRPHQIARLGVGYVPQREHTFNRMTVEENLEIGAMPFPKVDVRAGKDRVMELFPRLAERRHQPAGILSGGERQMLALARSVISNPHLLLLDEPSAGVDPGVVEIIWDRIEHLHAEGATILIVEQNARRALAMADRGYVLDLGQARFEGAGGELLNDPAVAELYLGGGQGPEKGGE